MICINTKPLTGNTIAPPLKLFDEYTVLQLYTCKCGQDHYDVGLVSKYEYVSCHTCSEMLPEGNKVHWCHPSRFADEAPVTEELNGNEVDTAAEAHKLSDPSPYDLETK